MFTERGAPHNSVMLNSRTGPRTPRSGPALALNLGKTAPDKAPPRTGTCPIFNRYRQGKATGLPPRKVKVNFKEKILLGFDWGKT